MQERSDAESRFSPATPSPARTTPTTLPSPSSPSPKHAFDFTRGCVHYSRGCKLRARCCGELFSCRFCHDLETPSHAMNRHLVQTVVCCSCDTEQPPGPSCSECGHNFGTYFCAVCRLYDDDVSKQQFHCDKCGICRVGGRDNFFHCDTCGACYSIELHNNHKCVPNSMQRNCPICYEFLFDSREAPQVLRCGHTIHRKCLDEYTAHGGYTCPLCKASVGDMQVAWELLDHEIRCTPMPEEYASKRVAMLCNDCHASGEAPFHILGLKCQPCGSYNTRQL